MHQPAKCRWSTSGIPQTIQNVQLVWYIMCIGKVHVINFTPLHVKAHPPPPKRKKKSGSEHHKCNPKQKYTFYDNACWKLPNVNANYACKDSRWWIHPLYTLTHWTIEHACIIFRPWWCSLYDAADEHTTLHMLKLQLLTQFRLKNPHYSLICRNKIWNTKKRVLTTEHTGFIHVHRAAKYKTSH